MFLGSSAGAFALVGAGGVSGEAASRADDAVRDIGSRLELSVDRSERAPSKKLLWRLKFGGLCLVLGLVAGWTLCPIVKRIWMPAWMLYSGGIVLWLLAAFSWIVDVRGWRAWTFPFVVAGMNSIAIYLLHSLLAHWILL